jgi:hypothetical protein
MAILNINAKEQLAQIEEDQDKYRNDCEAELTSAQRDLYQAFKALQRQAAAARQAFEDKMNADYRAEGAFKAGEALVFNYRFGKLSLSLGEARERKVRAQAQPRQSLGAWLKAQSDAGSAV